MSLSRRTVLASAIAAGFTPLQSNAAALTGAFKLVMLGDSLVEGYGLERSQAVPARLQADLLAQGVAVQVLNAGVSGETSANVLARINKSVPSGANGVLIAVGANDMLQLMPPQNLAANLRAMLSRLRERQILGALAGMQAPAFLRGAYQEQFDAVYPAVAREFNVPLYPFFLDGVMFDPDLNLDDGIHPNAAGANIIARKLAPFAVSAFGLVS